MDVQDSGAKIGIGIGCLAFVPNVAETNRDANDRQLSADRWKELLESGLGALASVTHLSVEITGLVRRMGTNGFVSLIDDYEADETEYDVDLDPGPTPYSFIGFSITIPERMQKPFLYPHEPKLGTERFQVFTFYGYEGPVTFVRSLDDATVGRSARYVAIIRDFLEQELSKVEDTPVRIVSTGPSPFHADITITPSSSAQAGLAYDWQPNELGYDKVEFYYSPNDETLTDAYMRVVETTKDQFAIYYYQVRARNRRMMRGAAVASMAQKLIMEHSRRGIRGWISKTFRSGSLARDLLLAAISAEQLDFEERSDLRDSLRKQSSRVKMNRLMEYCNEEVDRTYADRSTMAKEVANILEIGRMNQFQVFVVSVSTVLGGAAGAIAALIAR